MVMLSNRPNATPHPASVNGRDNTPPPIMVERRLKTELFTVPSGAGCVGLRT
jgi:hypothetical protein